MTSFLALAEAEIILEKLHYGPLTDEELLLKNPVSEYIHKNALIHLHKMDLITTGERGHEITRAGIDRLMMNARTTAYNQAIQDIIRKLSTEGTQWQP